MPQRPHLKGPKMGLANWKFHTSDLGGSRNWKDNGRSVVEARNADWPPDDRQWHSTEYEQACLGVDKGAS